jgi:hypothetical protein
MHSTNAAPDGLSDIFTPKFCVLDFLQVSDMADPSQLALQISNERFSQKQSTRNSGIEARHFSISEQTHPA